MASFDNKVFYTCDVRIVQKGSDGHTPLYQMKRGFYPCFCIFVSITLFPFGRTIYISNNKLQRQISNRFNKTNQQTNIQTETSIVSDANKQSWFISRNIMRSSMEARPLSGFYHISYVNFLNRNEFLFKNLSNLQSFRAIRALIASYRRLKCSVYVFLYLIFWE